VSDVSSAVAVGALTGGRLLNGQLRWTLKPCRRGAIHTVGRMDRQALLVRQINLAVPESLLDDIAQMNEGGGTQACYLALLVYAVDTLKQNKLKLHLELCGLEVDE